MLLAPSIVKKAVKLGGGERDNFSMQALNMFLKVRVCTVAYDA